MRYKVALYRSEEGYSVSVPGLPGCCSQGATEEEALENIASAIREYLEVAAELAQEAEVREVEVFEDGVLKPTQPLDLPAHAEVRVTIELLPASPLTVGKLNAFLRNLQALGDDAEEFAQDVRAARAEFPAEANPWD